MADAACPGGAGGGVTVRILLVDDDPNILDTGKDILEEAGYQVGAADCIAKALDILRAQTFDVMIADLHLPDGSGFDLAVLARQIRPSAKIMMMTGEAEVARSSSTVDDTLTKPVDPAELLQHLRKLTA